MRKITGVVLALMFVLIPMKMEASTPEISVFHNETKIEFIDQIPIVVNGSTLVPIRGIAESLGLEVEWDGNGQIVTLTQEDIQLELRVGNKGVIKRTRDMTSTIYLEVAPTVYNGRVLLPLRGVSEVTGAEVKWNGHTKRIDILSKFGEQIKTITAENKSLNKEINLSNTSKEIMVKLGNPEDVIKGKGNNEIWVFYPNTENHVQIGINKDLVTSISSMSQNWGLMGSQIGEPLARLREGLDLRSKYSKGPKDHIHSPMRQANVENVEILVFEDQRGRLTIPPFLGFEITKTRTPMDISKYNSYDAGKITHYFINDVRISNGLEPLRWDRAIYEVANYHSEDMHNNNYFSHDDAYGTFSDRTRRLLPKGESRGAMGENITMEITSAILSTASFFNSPGHYRNMVNTKFNYVGVGVYKGYITHVFSER